MIGDGRTGGAGSSERPQGGCEGVRERLWPLDRPRAWSSPEEEDRRHLGSCADCREYFRRDAAVGRVLARHGLAARTPAGLRERVFDQLARERALRAAGRFRSWRAGAWAAAAGALVLVLALLVLPGSTGNGDPFVQDFMNRAVEEEVVVGPEPAAVSRFFLREMGMTIQPVMLEDAHLSRAMICIIRGERAAMVEYDVDGHAVAHYRLPVERGRNGDRRIRAVRQEGVAIVRWSDGTFEHALVGAMEKDRLLELARQIAAR